MKVIALQAGFYGNSRVRIGQEFEVPEGTKGRWFEPVEHNKAPKGAKAEDKAPKGAKAQTLSEMANTKTQSMAQAMASGKGDSLA